MSTGPVIVNIFGVDWTMAKACWLLGGVLLVAGGVLFAMLVRHTGTKSEPLTPEEFGEMLAQRSRAYDDPVGTPYSYVKGVRGVKVERSFSIGSLRAAARRGDWFSFWAGPASFLCWIAGLWLALMGALVAFATPLGLRIVVTVVVGLVAAVILFMPWAAIYTSIEADNEAPTGEGREGSSSSGR